MKKILLFFGILIALLALLAEFVLPNILTGMLRDQVIRVTAAQEVDLSLDSSPRFMIAAGRVDNVHCDAVNGKIGELDTSKLTLEGDNVKVDMPAILFGLKEGKRHFEVDEVLKSVGNVELTGVITEDNLRDFLMKKFSQIEELQIKMTPVSINAIAKARVLGRAASVDLNGVVIADDGDLYFHATGFNIHNALLRHVQLDNFLADLKIVDADQLPLDLKFSKVEQQDGQTILTAVRTAQ